MSERLEILPEIPCKWIWTTIIDIAKDIITGNTPPKKEEKNYGNFIPLVKPPELNNRAITEADDFLSVQGSKLARILPINSVLVSCIGNLGKTGLSIYPIASNQQINAITFTPDFEPKYCFYFFQSSYAKEELNRLASATTIPIINKSKFSTVNFPLAPLPEQHRIVAKLEELFTKLDVSVAELKKAKAQIKRYRQSVLKSAFDGKLTNENVIEGELPTGWQRKQIYEISNVVRGGSPRPAGDPKYYDGTIPFLKVADLTRDDNVYVSSFEYTIKEAGLKKTRKIFPNTLLLTNSGATLGVPKISSIEATMNDGIAALLDLDERSLLYVYYFLLSKTDELRKVNQGAAQPNLNTTIIKNVYIPLPPFNEQNQIVSEIERHFSVADATEKIIDQSLTQAERLRQSILKDAFTGKLVPQDPSDEPAEKLLERIKTEREKKQITVSRVRGKLK